MKQIGIIILALCPATMGILYSINLSRAKNQILKIIDLINWLLTEIRYKKSETTEIISSLCEIAQFKSLNFLPEVKKQMKNFVPFPKAWELETANWNCALKNEDLNLLKSISSIVGASDCEGQIFALNHLKLKFENSLKIATNEFNSKGKLARTLGILMSIAIYIVTI